MSIRQKLAAAPFAHLLGLSVHAEEDDDARKGKRAEEEDDDKEKDEDKKSKKGKRAEEKDDDEKDDDARRAEEDDKDDGDDKKSRRAEEDDGESDDGDQSKKGKKAKKAEDEDADDDDDDDEMKGNSASAKARRRERARCAAIFASPAAAGLPHVAANLAFNTDMSRKEAITVLKSVAASQPKPILGVTLSTLSERMANNPVPRVGLDGGSSKTAGMSPVAAAIVAAGEKARPSK